jgi:hypothetical protein
MLGAFSAYDSINALAVPNQSRTLTAVLAAKSAGARTGPVELGP